MDEKEKAILAVEQSQAMQQLRGKEQARQRATKRFHREIGIVAVILLVWFVFAVGVTPRLVEIWLGCLTTQTWSVAQDFGSCRLGYICGVFLGVALYLYRDTIFCRESGTRVYLGRLELSWKIMRLIVVLVVLWGVLSVATYASAQQQALTPTGITVMANYTQCMFLVLSYLVTVCLTGTFSLTWPEIIAEECAKIVA